MIGQYGNNWKALYNEQIDCLKNSGLYDNVEFIDLFVKGMDPIPFQELPNKVNNVTYLGELEEERPTNRKLYRAYNQILQRMWAFSNANPEYKVLFFHSIGVSHGDTDIGRRTRQFRKYFETCLIDYWKDCVDILNHYDCVGTEYIPNATFRDGTIEFHAPHYQGFFWWANASYLKKLDPCYFYQDVLWQPYLCELWIGSGNPNAYNFHNTWRNRYYNELEPIPYEEIIQSTRNHIKELCPEVKKPKMAFVMNSSNKCGIYEYGKLTLNNLQKSNNYDYTLIEALSEDEFKSKYELQNYVGIVWNAGPFDWMMHCLSNISQNDVPNFVITGHGSLYQFPNIKQHFVCDPSFSQNSVYVPLERPLIKFNNLDRSESENAIKIGSFGFGGWKKNFTGIVEAVNDQFTEPVIINFNMAYGDYFEYHAERGISHIVADKCREIANPNVTVNVTHEYLDVESVVKFLSLNDINIFLYHNEPMGGISSCVDFALMAEKPLMVNKSNQFKNINWKDELTFEHNTIKEVIERGLEPTNEFRIKWSTENIIKTYENEFNKYTIGVLQYE